MISNSPQEYLTLLFWTPHFCGKPKTSKFSLLLSLIILTIGPTISSSFTFPSSSTMKFDLKHTYNNIHHDSSSLSQSVSKVHDETQDKKHLILVGGGHAHIQVIKALNTKARPSNLDVTLIDLQENVFYSGMVPGCVSNLYTPSQTQISLSPLAKWAGINFICEKVIDANFIEQTLSLSNGNQISFDCVSFDIGSTTRGTDTTKGVLQYTIPTRPISKLVSTFDELHLSNAVKPEPIVVVGGGPAGIELAMAIRARSNPKQSIELINAGQDLIPSESSKCRQALLQILKEKNILIKNQCVVQQIDDTHIHISDLDQSELTLLPYSHCLWATGAAPHTSFVNQIKSNPNSIAFDSTGWIRVNNKLQSVSHPNVFAAGDCATIEGLKHGKRSPPKAGVYAVRSGPILINNLVKYTCGDDDQKDEKSIPQSYIEYEPQDDFLKLLMCGDGKALGFRFGIPIYGKWVWQLKDHIDQMFMDLFDEKNLPDIHQETNLDMSQYDAVTKKRPTPLPAIDAATLLKRTDDDVDFHRAWDVIRDMMDDETYKLEVLDYFSD